MTSMGRMLFACFASLIACALIPQLAVAQAPPPGVFAEIQSAVVPRPSSALEPGTVRSRVVQVDTQRITAARRGREVLKLNLFDDAVVEVQIKRVRPTRSGYFISGRPQGMEWGAVRLVVNGPVMVGTVETPEGTFTIRSGGGSRHIIRQIDPSAVPFSCGVEDHAFPSSSQQESSSVDPALSLAGQPTAQANDLPTEDGSEIRVLVVYTPAMQAAQGGAAGMRAFVDLLVQSADQAFEDSGINPRLVLAYAAMVDYVAIGPSVDLSRLSTPDDGYMDEVHALRNEYAADLVHLLTNVVSIYAAGVSYPFSSESLSHESSAAFAVTAQGREQTFTHETGHNFGLMHDRYWEKSSAVYPYAYGYVNKSAFEPIARTSARWRTVMSYNDRCNDAGFVCEPLLRFSNPDQTYKGDPLGVPADDPSTGPDGPADARLAINKTAQWVGSFRSEACTDFTVSPEPQIAPVDGGEVVLKVDTTPGCLWEGSSQSEFLEVTRDAKNAGPGILYLQVEANETGAERSGMLTVAGQDITVLQLATDAGICGRTSSVALAIMEGVARFPGPGRCDEVTADDLAGIISLDLRHQGLSALKEKDFEGLSQLRFLLLGGNQLIDLPAGLFDGLSNLEQLQLSSDRLTELPAGLFDGLSNLEQLRLDHNGLTDLPEGLFEGLSNLENLFLSYNQLADLPAGLFEGLSNLGRLGLEHNQLADLSAGLFDGLSNLEWLHLGSNQLADLREGLFDDLYSLESLWLGFNQFTDLPEGQFAGLSNLEQLGLSGNQLTDLPEGLFAGLSNLEHLGLSGNQLTDLPEGLFDGLSNLSLLELEGNELASLPDGIFSGLTALQTLRLRANAVDPLPLSISLEKVGDSQFKAVASTGAPFTLALPVSTSSAGTIEGGASTVTIPIGAVESAPLRVERMAATEEAVNVDIDALPTAPSSHDGYVLQKDATLPRWILASSLPTDVALVLLSLSEGTLAPAFAADTLRYTSFVENAVSSVTVTPATRNEDATVTFLDASDSALADADASTHGHQVNLSVGDNTFKVQVTSEDRTTVQTYTLVVTRLVSTCDRTVQVRDAIVAASRVDACGYATVAHLSKITELRLSNESISSLKRSDFRGLPALRVLHLEQNQLADLPEGLFDGLSRLESLRLGFNRLSELPERSLDDLSNLETLDLRGNRLSELPEGLFDGLSNLEYLGVTTNSLTELPEGLFDDLSNLKNLELGNNQFTELPEGLFAGLSNLDRLGLGANELTSLPANVFSGLSALRVLVLDRNQLTDLSEGQFAGLPNLEWLHLETNQLSDLPADVFSGLSVLGHLWLHRNQLTSLPDGIFSGLPALRDLSLGDNQLTSLPAGIFSGLPALQQLRLESNQLTSLPANVFSGLTVLELLRVSGNMVDPLPLSVSLEKVGQSQFKAIAPTGAPFTLVVPVNISSTGMIEGGASTVTIPAGAVESLPLLVTRVDGTVGDATVDIGALPGLPENHTGYALEKDETLPRGVSPALKVPPPGQVTGVEVTPGLDQLEVSWTAVADASGYKVQWKSGEEAYDEARQASVASGDTVSETILDLSAGRQYTIRVIATKENADDGPPSSEMTGTPKSSPPAQVTEVEVTAGVDQLAVSWAAVADAGGYKVQWKSGEEAYADTRQELISGGDTVSHTITGLAAGTEYTVRVIAVMENADDGPSSSEMTGTPKASPPALVTGVEITAGIEQLGVSWVAVSDADGYKVQWKSGEQAYAESRQAVIPDGDTVNYTIPDLTADTQYTVRVMATKDNAEDGSPSAEVMATPTAADPDVNGDGLLRGDDALVMYHAYASASQVGDGETGGTAASRQTLLSGLAGLANPSDEDLKAMIRKAHGWRESGVDAGGDLNEDGAIDESDAFVMYYAYELEELVGDGETGGTVRFRQLLLAAFASQPNPSDEDLKAMLRRANALREEFG